MSKWLAVAVSIMFLFGLSSAACTIAPASWSFSMHAGNSATTSFVLSSDANVTSTLYAAGSHGNWYSFPPSVQVNVTNVSNSTSFNLTVAIPANTTPENFTSFILGVGGCTFTINLTGENKGNQQAVYAYTVTRYTTKGDQITILPFNIKLQLTDVQTDFIQFDEYLGENKRQGGVILEVGDVFDDEDDAYHLTLVKTYSASGMAKLQFKSDESISVQASTGSSGLCKLQSDWNSMSFEVEQGSKTEASISLRNMCDKTISLQSLQIVPIGSSIWKLPNKGTKDIQTNEIFPVALVVDGTDAEVGTYSATFRASGYLPDGKLIEASVPLTVEITEGAVPLFSGSSSSQFSIPETLAVAEQGVLSATSVPCRDCVKVDVSPVDGSSCDLRTVSFKNSIWSVQCKFTGVQIYTVKMSVVSQNGLPTGSSVSKDIFVGISDIKLNILVEPALKVGTKSTISVQDSYYNRPVNATLTLDNLPISAEYTPTAAKNATICASKYPYISSCSEFQIAPSRTVAAVSIQPDYPFDDEDIIVSATDEQGNQINGTLTLDGSAISAPFKAKEGAHKLTISTIYGEAEKDFMVYSSPTITAPDRAKVGTVVKVEFSRVAPYAIFYKASEEASEAQVGSGSPVSSLDYNLTEVGIYRFEAGEGTRTIISDNLGALDVLGSWLGLNGDTFGVPNWLLFPAILLVLALIVLFWVVPAMGNRGRGYSAPSMGNGIQGNRPF